ncbi:MAG: hypothetical protein V3V16_07915 [Melioribacteraceae bacterium]
MKIIKSYKQGFTKTLSLLGMTTLIYFFTLLIGMTIALPFKTALTKAIGFSMSPSILVSGFDYTIYEDFMRNYGDAIKPFIQIMLWVGLAYLIFSIFFAGGILNILQNENNKFSMKSFFEGCGKYFFRFLRLSGIVIILNIIIAFAVYIPLGMIFSSVFETVESEASLFYIGVGGVVIHLFFAILTLIISDYTKMKLVTEETTKVFRTFWQAIKFTVRHLFSTYTLYVMLMIFPVLLFIIYYFIEKSIGMTSGATILIMFLLQQIFIWLRQVSKVWNYSSQFQYHNNFIEPKLPEVLPPTSEEWDLKDLINPTDDASLSGDLIA